MHGALTEPSTEDRPSAVAKVGIGILVLGFVAQRAVGFLVAGDVYGEWVRWFAPGSGFVFLDLPLAGPAAVTELALTAAVLVCGLFTVTANRAWRPTAIAVAVLVIAHTLALYWFDYRHYLGFSGHWEPPLVALVWPTLGAVLLLAGSARAGGRSASDEASEAELRTAGLPTLSPKSPDRLVNDLVGALAMAGCVVTSVTDTVVAGQRTVRGRVNWLVAFLWWLLCIVPMIIYIVSASKDRTDPFTVVLTPSGEGTTVTVNAQDETLLVVRGAVDRVV